MQVTPDAKKEILKLLEKKIEADEMWAEAFSKLAGLDESGQNAAVWDLLESVKSAMRWDELFARSPEKMQAMADAALKEVKERDAGYAGRQKGNPEVTGKENRG